MAEKWAIAFITLAIIGFLLVTSPGWADILGIAGMETQALTVVILVLVTSYLYLVLVLVTSCY